MRTLLAALLAATLAAPLPVAFHSYAMAGERVYTADEYIALKRSEPLPLKERIRRNGAHERQAWDAFVSAGGCGGEVVQHDYTITCMRSVFGAPVMGSQGGD